VSEAAVSLSEPGYYVARFAELNYPVPDIFSEGVFHVVDGCLVFRSDGIAHSAILQRNTEAKPFGRGKPLLVSKGKAVVEGRRYKVRGAPSP
jgi:hypothetical protein